MAKRYTIVADITPVNYARTHGMTKTRTGVVIGIAHEREKPAPSKDAERLQRALLDSRECVDWDGIVIAAFIAAVALAVIFA